MNLPSGAQFLIDIQQPSFKKFVSPYFSKYWDPPSPFTPAPPTREGWERRHELSAATPALIADLAKEGYKISSVEMQGHGIFHMVYILKLEDGSQLLARISFNYKTDLNSHDWAETKMKREVAVLQLLRSISFVPNVIHCNPSTKNDLASPYMVLQKLSGVPFGKEGYQSILPSMVNQERFVRSLAEAFVQIFSVTLPEIGTVVDLTSDGQAVIGPLVDVGETDHVVAEGPFKTIEEYLGSMIILANVRNGIEQITNPKEINPDGLDLSSLLDRLRTLARLLIPEDNALARIALVHSDANADNILIHDGVLSGLIDWEKSAALPAYLAARYPPFLRSDGIWDPRFESRDQKMYRYPQEWPTTEQDFEHLRRVFRNTAAEANPEYVEALEKGEKLRQLFEWLEFSQWSGQTTWYACDQWAQSIEQDHDLIYLRGDRSSDAGKVTKV